jgi:hypothetical protein
VGYVVRAAKGRPGLTENALVDLAEAAALRASVDLGVLTAGRRTISLKDPIYEVTLVQHLFEYLLMYPGLDEFDPGWEVPSGKERVDIVLTKPQKSVLVECKDYKVGAINDDAQKLKEASKTKKTGKGKPSKVNKYRNPAAYVLCFWRGDAPPDIAAHLRKAYTRKNGLDGNLTRFVASKEFEVFRPEEDHPRVGVALLQVLL